MCILKYISERAVRAVFSEKSGMDGGAGQSYPKKEDMDGGAGQPFPKKKKACRMMFTELCGDSLLDRTAVGDVFLER